jgi:sulfite reductase (NADPH) hemoprotein beta-component
VRVTHEQNLLLPWVRCDQLPELWREAKALGLAKPNIGLLTDMIACPGGDFCDAGQRPLAAHRPRHHRALPDLDELHDLGEIDLHISGCINSCGHHHSGHIGILGVDKDGRSGTRSRSAAPTASCCRAKPGARQGDRPVVRGHEVPDVIEALIDTYCAQRQPAENFHRHTAP